MLIPAVIVHDTAAASVLTGFGVIVFAFIAALTVALWVVVARGKARQEARDFDDSESDPALAKVRRRPIVFLPWRGTSATGGARSRKTAAPNAASLAGRPK
jgi:hypothetical protein